MADRVSIGVTIPCPYFFPIDKSLHTLLLAIEKKQQTSASHSWLKYEFLNNSKNTFSSFYPKLCAL